MTPVRAVVVALAAVSAFTSAIAAPPGAAKAKRLAPADPPPASVQVPEEPQIPILGSCALGAGSCADYQGAFAGMDVKGLCAKSKGTWSATPCPAENAIGTCTQRQDGSEDRILTRAYAPETVEAARKACVSKPRGIFLQAK